VQQDILDQFANAVITRIDPALENIRRDITKLTNKVDHLDTKLDTKVKDLDKKITRLDGKVTKLNDKVAALDSKVRRLDDKVTLLDGKVTTLNGHVVKMSESVKDLKKQVTKVETKVNNIESIVDDVDERMGLVHGATAKTYNYTMTADVIPYMIVPRTKDGEMPPDDLPPLTSYAAIEALSNNDDNLSAYYDFYYPTRTQGRLPITGAIRERRRQRIERIMAAVGVRRRPAPRQ